MDHGLDRSDPSQLDRYNQHQSNSAYSIPHNDNLSEEWSFNEYFYPHPAPLDMNYIQAGTPSEPDYGGIPPGFTRDFTDSQSSSQMMTIDIGSDHSSPVWTAPPNGVPEVYGSPLASGTATEHANSHQGTIGSATTVQILSVAPNLPSHSYQPLSTHLPIIYEPMSDEYMKPPKLALQHSFKPLPIRGLGGNSFNNIPLYVLPTPVSVFYYPYSVNPHLIITLGGALYTASAPYYSDDFLCLLFFLSFVYRPHSAQ
ncbi:MAG: hypothetical protein M1813_007497 [Trichoglossum hirsutum]|nr:MAG: hypothetical protein M1813_007497 [Trichoglossum hirsutum]